MKGKSIELVEKRSRVNVACLLGIRRKGDKAKEFTDCYKLRFGHVQHRLARAPFRRSFYTRVDGQ